MLCCDQCGYVTRFPSWLTRHLLVHQDAKAFFCNTCRSSFKTSSAYQLHLREKHGAGAYICEECGAQFQHKRVLERHCLCHRDERPFACGQCSYRSKRKHDVDFHIRAMHSDGKPRRKRHEEALASLFVSWEISFVREYVVKVHTFQNRKSARIDFCIPMPWGALLFECDEMQHGSYKVANECQRMRALWDYHQHHYPAMSLHIIRYNPNVYKQDGCIKKPSQAERTASIKACLQFVPESPQFVISYLFYRSATDGRPAIMEHPEYTLQKYVRQLCDAPSADRL